MNKPVFDMMLNYKKHSGARMLVKTFIVTLFTIIFGMSLYHDLNSGTIRWQAVSAVIFFTLCIGFTMSKMVPIFFNEEDKSITFSFDRVYFLIILFLVITKTIAQQILMKIFLSDIIMCVLVGLMSGRLIGLYIIIYKFKLKVRC